MNGNRNGASPKKINSKYERDVVQQKVEYYKQMIDHNELLLK